MDIISFLVSVAVLILVLKLLSLPFKLIMKFITNSIIGGIVIIVLKYFGIIVNLEWWTIVLTGIFGVPGVVIALVISMLM